MKRNRKRALVLILILLGASILIGGSCGYILYYRPLIKYEEASRLFSEKQYDEAIARFNELDGFRDSENLIAQAEEGIKEEKYKAANALYENGSDNRAIQLLQEISDYKNSNDLIEEIDKAYFEKLKSVFSKIYIGYMADKELTSSVEFVLERVGSVGGGSEYLATYNLYRGEEYHSLWGLIFDSQYADAVVRLLDISNENIEHLELAVIAAKDPPEKYNSLYNQLNEAYEFYVDYHSFAASETSSSYSVYAAENASKEKPLADKIERLKNENAEFNALISYLDSLFTE